MTTTSAKNVARIIRDQLPTAGLFAGHDWRVAPAPFRLGETLYKELETLGRVLLQFNRAVNLLYHHSSSGKQPDWVARWLNQGKPDDLVALQRGHRLKNDLPRVIRPDILLTEHGMSITELDSVPGGIGLTAWLNQVYSTLPDTAPVVGGARGMISGFSGIFGGAPRVHVIVSEEAATYKPEMEWLAGQIKDRQIEVHDAQFSRFSDGDAVYRFFELFDLANVPSAREIFDAAGAGRITVTPPPKAFLEEKMLFALLWNRNLREFWHRSLGASFFKRLQDLVPYSWVVDPAPLPPHGAIPELNLTDWQQLKTLSQRERDLILKVSGFSEKAWGARGVFLGSDLSAADWSAAVDEAIACFGRSPFVLQRYHKPRLVETAWYNYEKDELVPMHGRVRLCPYYFVIGEGDAARAHLGGVLATICPADKKIIHGMRDAVMAPCAV